MSRPVRTREIVLMLAVSAAGTLYACGGGGAAVADGTEAARDVTARWTSAAGSGDAAAVAALYTENAQTIPPGGPALSGRAEIESYWRADAGDGSAKTILTPTDAVSLGDHLSVVGTYEVTGADGVSIAKGQYQQLWTAANGQRQLHREMWRLDPGAERGNEIAEQLVGAWTKSYNSGDVKMLMNLYGENATLTTRPDGTLSGRTPIESFWTGDLASGKPSSALTVADAYVVGNLAHLEGEYTVTVGKTPTSGRFMQLWMREGPDWKIQREMWLR